MIVMKSGIYKAAGLLLAFALLIFASPALAAINPVYKECSQRGYAISGGECIFPDGTSCPLEEFNSGTCGSAFKTQDYCVRQGQHVWDSDKCCEGLRPYLPEGVAGQATCEPYFSAAAGDVYLAAGILIIILILAYVFAKKKRR